MKTLIIYFTGTYNTKYLVEKIKERFQKDELGEITTFSIDGSSKPISLTPFDLIIFSYPIYAFNTPIIFDRFVKKLHFHEKQKVIIAKQSGEPLKLNNSSSYSLIRKINREKAILLGEYHFLMPYNIHFRYDDNFIKELFNYNNKLLDILIYEYKNKIIRKVKYNLFYAFNSFIFKIQRLGGPVNSYFYKVDYSKCIRCNRCVNECPINNIVIKNNKYKFKNKCIMCMRCSFNCPKDAINIGMLNGWRVNGGYDYKRIINDSNIRGEYLKEHNKGFYKIFKKIIKENDEKYNEYFSQK